MTNKNGLKVVFMGTPDFAVPVLEAILKSTHQILAVVTSPDKPAGRGLKLSESAVKKTALKHRLELLQPENLKDPNFIACLQQLQPDVIVVVAFRMLPKAVWQLPKKGTFNLHASLLPDYRGAAPIHWAIINGEQHTGLTTFFIDEKIDTGAIIDQVSLPIECADTTGSLHDKLAEVGAQLVVKTLDDIQADAVRPKIQKHITSPKIAPKLDKSVQYINWDMSGQQIINKIRGLYPFPVAKAFMHYGDEVLDIKIQKAQFLETKVVTKAKGKVLADKKSFKVVVKDGLVELLEFQLPGKKPLKAEQILAGLDLSKPIAMKSRSH
ncbi:MAG: methionyl-tRNA formyltransferase [Flavobacteriaceae bacterium]|nr:methionyl-tRNA formyltransferase [Flavobacteriaceae bacterium]